MAKELEGTLFESGNIVEKFRYPAQMAGIAILDWIANGVIYEERGIEKT